MTDRILAKGVFLSLKLVKAVTIDGDGGNYTPAPIILLKGKWLEEAGFKSGEYVEAIIEGDKIALAKTNPPEVSSKKSLEEKIKDLDPEQKKEISEDY